MKYDVMELGPRVKGKSVTFRIWLPNMDPEARILVVGSFCDWEMEDSLSLRYDSESQMWKGTLEDLDDGFYEYGFVVKTGTWYSNLSTDPYAKMTGESGNSAFTIPSQRPARLDTFDRPPLDELVLYKLDLDDFNENFEGVTKRVLHYLADLGVNGVIFSPWVGYDHSAGGEKIPVHLNAPDYKYGTPYDLKVMINECHNAGIAVIMDMDLHAVSPAFGFNQMYPLFANKPMLGRMDQVNRKIYLNYEDEFARDFAYEVCRWWLDEFNVDGFRFLNACEYWDGPDGEGLSHLLSRIYKMKKKEGEKVYLFVKHCKGRDAEILNESHVNGVDNYRFFRRIHRMAENRTLNINFWKTLDLNQLNYSEEAVIGEDTVPKTALSCIEDNENHRLIVKLGVISGERDNLGYPVGDRRNHWWKIKPYIIAQFTGSGIPLIYNGQEIGENRYLPDSAPDRYKPRPLGWQFLADFAGKDLHRFHQKLVLLRTKFKSIRSRNFFHYFSDPDRQVVAFKRYLDDESVVVAINFSNEGHEVELPFPANGVWHEYLDDYEITVIDRKATAKIPARYGVVFYQE